MGLMMLRAGHLLRSGPLQVHHADWTLRSGHGTFIHQQQLHGCIETGSICKVWQARHLLCPKAAGLQSGSRACYETQTHTGLRTRFVTLHASVR